MDEEKHFALTLAVVAALICLFMSWAANISLVLCALFSVLSWYLWYLIIGFLTDE